MSSGVGSRLAVFLASEELGELERRGPGRYRFTYAPSAVERHATGGVVLSASLPLQLDPIAPARAAPFFEGLLPEGAVRSAIANSFRLSEEDGFGLLQALGAECAGAVAILPPGARPTKPGGGQPRPLGEAELLRLIDDLPRNPLGVSPNPDGARLSLGGIQHKLVLAHEGRGRFSQPLDGAPSTCLLKPGTGEYEDLVFNEAFCMRTAGMTGLSVSAVDVVQIGPTACLYVERFDRARDVYDRVIRIHQEDMCQALGILPAAKYQENGGPSIPDIVELLRRLRGRNMAKDVNDLVHAALVNFLLGNSDAHGKNFALLYAPGEGPRLAPLYDIVSTAVYPDVTDQMAMSIGGVFDPSEVDLGAWEGLARECGFGRGMASLVKRRAAHVMRSAEHCRRTAIEGGWHRPVVDAIVDVCRERANRLIGGL